MLKNIIRIILGSVSIFFIYRYLSAYDFSVLRSIGWKDIIPVFGVVSLALFLGIYYEKYILLACRIRLPFRKIIPIFIAVQLIGRLRVGIFGPFAALYSRAKIAGMNYKESLVVMFVDNFLRFAVLCILSIGAASAIFGWRYPAALPLAAAVIGLSIFVYLAGHPNMTRNPLGRIYRRLNSLSGRNLVLSLAIYMTASVLYTTVSFLLLHPFHYSPNIFLLWGINAISLLVGVLSFIPMGLGTQDAASLSLLMVIGIDKNAAVTCVLLYRVFCTVFPLVIMLIFGNIFLWRKEPVSRNNGNG